MSLLFGGATSDRVSYNVPSVLENFTAWTFWAWVYPTTIGATRAIFHHGISSGTSGFKNFGVRNTGQMSIDSEFTTTEANGRSTNGAGHILTANKWWFVAGVLDSSKVPHTFMGDLTTTVYENTYATQTTGVGTNVSDATGVGAIGNRDDNTFAFQGRIAVCGYENIGMTLAELKRLQFQPHKTASTKLLYRLGFNGTGTQPDMSGNGTGGTVTGATLAADVPIISISGRDTRARYTVAAAAPNTYYKRSFFNMFQ
jgi:hypothetical protein